MVDVGCMLVPCWWHFAPMLVNNVKMWAQHIKQFVLMTSGIETKSQGEMDKGDRENYIMSKYYSSMKILMTKFPDTEVHP